MHIIEKIRAQMKIRGWSEYRLAQEAHLPQSTINTLFRKNNNPSLFTLECICHAFHMTLSEFFKEDSETNDEETHVLELWRGLADDEKQIFLSLLKTLNKKT